MAKRDAKPITIIRREEIIAGGHHGGAWKVAYADFVTAMMAFFLLMWLLNATTEAQRRGLADYFSPSASVANSRSGTGLPLGGKSPFEDGEAVSDAPPVDVEDDGSDTMALKTVHAEGGKGGTQDGGAARQAGNGPAAQRAAEVARRAEQAAFAKAAAQMQKVVDTDPELAPIARQLSIDLTPEGLRVQIRDAEGLPMFTNGSAEPNARATAVLQRLTPMLQSLHEPVAIAGYTDATPYSGIGRSNWDLSAERANATRRILTDAGLPDARIRDVTGHGDRDLLMPDTPEAPANRRIAILLVRTAPPVQPAVIGH
jgi:chemotaxis protein MotB